MSTNEDGADKGKIYVVVARHGEHWDSIQRDADPIGLSFDGKADSVESSTNICLLLFTFYEMSTNSLSSMNAKTDRQLMVRIELGLSERAEYPTIGRLSVIQVISICEETKKFMMKVEQK